VRLYFFEKVVLLIHSAKRRIGRFLPTMGLMGLSFTVAMERAACVTISHRYPKEHPSVFETRSTLVPFLFFPKESCPFIPCIPIPKTNHALADLSPSTALLTTSQPQQCPTTTPQKPSVAPGRPPQSTHQEAESPPKAVSALGPQGPAATPTTTAHLAIASTLQLTPKNPGTHPSASSAAARSSA
jgi:hypothetical protein